MINKDENQIYEKYRLCPKCGGKVPQGYMFCSSCGNALTAPKQQNDYAGGSAEYKSKEPEVYKSIQVNNKTANNSRKGLIAALSVLCCLLAAGLVFEYSQVMIANSTIEKIQQDQEDQAKRISEMQNTIDNCNSKISSQSSTIAELQEKNTQLKIQKEKAENDYRSAQSAKATLAQIGNFLNRTDAGRANSRYYSDEKVVLLRKGQPAQKLWITSNHTVAGTIYYSQSGGSVSCKWSTDSWETRTYLLITPLSVGASTITFTSSYDSDSFQVLVVVVD